MADERADEFERELYALFPLWRACADLRPGRIPQIIKRHGSAVDAVKQLVMSPELSPGFVRLRDSDCMKSTVEWLVLRREFGSLFTAEQRGVARRKLVENGVPRSDLPLEPYS